ncbi:MAG: hypothetical protein P8J87_17190, partial [Verrucomicrobiales bacterium]|nr:hypothetical protein [Verrucomicrobiales bacterium]
MGWVAANLALGLQGVFAEPAPVEFNTDIRLLLSDNCFACHGPDEEGRKSGLRLDIREPALRPAKSGQVAVVPGQPDDSELVRRIFSTDPDERMPPPSSNKQLDAPQKKRLKRW